MELQTLRQLFKPLAEFVRLPEAQRTAFIEELETQARIFKAVDLAPKIADELSGSETEQTKDAWNRFSEIIHEKKAKFDALADEWHKATRLHSSIALKAMHPAYQKIIGMGKDALPFIFERLQSGPGHWFWALTSITGEMPVPKEHLGQVAKMREYWIAWGQRNGYVDASRRRFSGIDR